MDVMEAIRTRKSVRDFLDKPIEEEKLDTLLEAARLAPSACNRQEWRFVVVKDKDTRSMLAEAAKGQLNFRADATQHRGDYARIIGAINNTLDWITGPFGTAVDYP